MKIGVLIHYHTNERLEAQLRAIPTYGMDCCQIACWDPSLYTAENAAALKKMIAGSGVEVTALWAGWTGPAEWNFTQGPHTLGLVPAAYRYARLVELMRASDFAEQIGVDTVVTHVGFLPEVPSDPDFMGTVGVLRKLTGYMKAKGQTFLFETGQETPVTMLRCIEAIGNDNVGVNLDTANLILYGKANTVDALDVFGKYVKNTHCKDGFYPTEGTKLGREVPLGKGKANLPKVYEKLRELGYTGPFIIEREIEGEEQIRDVLMARDYLRAIAKGN